MLQQNKHQRGSASLTKHGPFLVLQTKFGDSGDKQLHPNCPTCCLLSHHHNESAGQLKRVRNLGNMQSTTGKLLPSTKIAKQSNTVEACSSQMTMTPFGPPNPLKAYSNDDETIWPQKKPLKTYKNTAKRLHNTVSEETVQNVPTRSAPLPFKN